MMKRRTKLRKSLLRTHSQPTLNKLMAIEEDIITSHNKSQYLSLHYPMLVTKNQKYELTQ